MAVISPQRAGQSGRRPYDSLLDVDVHPIMREGIEVLVDYMPARWREVFRGLSPIPAPSGFGYPFPVGKNTLVPDATPPDGTPPGSSPEFMIEDLFDRYEIAIGQLIFLEATAAEGLCPDPEMAAVLISAYNDYIFDRWLIDERMRYALNVSAADPLRAAAEIRRRGSDPRVCSVHVNLTAGRLMGHQHFHPIYAAAVEHGLPIINHGGGGIGVRAETYCESRVNVALGAMANVNSLVMQGTFERFPSLKVMFVECGFSWIVPLMWRMDAGRLRHRNEVPWLKRPPSEYVRDHIRLSTQPVDDDPEPVELYRQIENETLYLCETLTYSTDYPHWDNDRPGAVLTRLSDRAQRMIFCDNAKNFLRLG